MQNRRGFVKPRRVPWIREAKREFRKTAGEWEGGGHETKMGVSWIKRKVSQHWQVFFFFFAKPRKGARNRGIFAGISMEASGVWPNQMGSALNKSFENALGENNSNKSALLFMIQNSSYRNFNTEIGLFSFFLKLHTINVVPSKM